MSHYADAVSGGVWDRIKDTKPGEDLYGVLEKLAYLIHQKTGRDDSFENWSDAQGSLFVYLVRYHPQDVYYTGTDKFVSNEVSIMADRIYSSSNNSNQFRNWNDALHQFASKVFDLDKLLIEKSRRFRCAA